MKKPSWGMSTRRIRSPLQALSIVCRHHGGTEWYDRAEDDVPQEQSDGAPSGGVGEHAVGSSGGRGGAERGERTGDMKETLLTPSPSSVSSAHSKSLFV